MPNHPIFQGPFPVAIAYEDVETPSEYRRYFDGAALPPRIPVWHVDAADYTTDDTLQPGTVANGWGFTDSPDAEVIAHGINSKGPSAVALGRHGSLFLWGFACPPSRMTDSGRNAFLNAICYMRDFDHAPRLVQNIARDRSWFLQRQAADPSMMELARRDLEYVRYEDREFVVDADCKALGIPNRRIELLEGCIDNLEAATDVERSRRVLARYTGLDLADAAAWRAWLSKTRARLFFSDVGGYRFFEEPASDAVPTPQSNSAESSPVTIAATLSTKEARPGEIITVDVVLSHQDGWHTYLRVPKDSPHEVTRLWLDLPSGWATVGGWMSPRGIADDDDPELRLATGTVVFRQRIRIAEGTAPGGFDFDVGIGVLACDDERCLPPEDHVLSLSVQVLAGK